MPKDTTCTLGAQIPVSGPPAQLAADYDRNRLARTLNNGIVNSFGKKFETPVNTNAYITLEKPILGIYFY